MDIWMIWVRESDGVVWLEAAWDDDSVSENDTGWEEAKAKAYASYKPENVLIVTTMVDLNAIQAHFNNPLTVGSTGLQKREDS